MYQFLQRRSSCGRHVVLFTFYSRRHSSKSLKKNLTELTSSRWSTFNYTLEKFESICCNAGRMPDIKISQPLHLRGHLYQQRVTEVAADQCEPLNVAAPLRRYIENPSFRYSLSTHTREIKTVTIPDGEDFQRFNFANSPEERVRHPLTACQVQLF